MNKPIVLLAVAGPFVLAGVVWRFSGLTGESAGPIATADPGQAAVERTLQRTLKESTADIESPPTVPAPLDDAASQAISLPQAEPPEPGSITDQLPEGYSPGTYRGTMQRA